MLDQIRAHDDLKDIFRENNLINEISEIPNNLAHSLNAQKPLKGQLKKT